MTQFLKIWRWPLPITFLMLYLGAIFGFAWAYYASPGEFYHSTIEHEASMRLDAAYIKERLRASMISSYKESHKESAILKGNGWVASVDDLKLSNMTYDNRCFRFSVTLPKRNIDGDKLPSADPTDPDFIIAWLFPRAESGVDRDIDRSQPTGKNVHLFFPKPPKEQVMFKLIGGQVGDDGGWFAPELDMFHRMIAYADAMEGFPGRTSGSFWRMFYLSTVTITTLGLGDIVPITTKTRMLLASEAIVGTIIIGLYLWALTEHFGKQRNAS
jgi:Ion channel